MAAAAAAVAAAAAAKYVVDFRLKGKMKRRGRDGISDIIMNEHTRTHACTQ